MLALVHFGLSASIWNPPPHPSLLFPSPSFRRERKERGNFQNSFLPSFLPSLLSTGSRVWKMKLCGQERRKESKKRGGKGDVLPRDTKEFFLKKTFLPLFSFSSFLRYTSKLSMKELSLLLLSFFIYSTHHLLDHRRRFSSSSSFQTPPFPPSEPFLSPGFFLLLPPLCHLLN